MNQCIRLADSLQSFANVRPVDEVKKAIVGIWSVVGYVRHVSHFKSIKFYLKYFDLFLFLKSLSDFLNRRGKLLDLDFLASISLPSQYDTDLENFWTQTSKKIINF